METFKAIRVKEDCIELANSEDLGKVYNVIENEENFVLEWTEADLKNSEVIIGNNLLAKIKNGDLKLSSQEAK